MEADASLGRAARIVVLHAETTEDSHLAVVHVDGDLKVVLPQRLAQQVAGAAIQVEQRRDVVELVLRHLERVEAFRHVMHLRTSGLCVHAAHFRHGRDAVDRDDIGGGAHVGFIFD